MKRILCALMTVMLLLPFCAAAAEETAGDGYTPVRGTAALYFENGGEGREVRIGDSVFYAADGDTPMVSVNMTVSGVDTANGELRVNGSFVGNIKNGSVSYDVPRSLLENGDNVFEILPSAGSGAVFDPSRVYGTYNLDDIVIESFSVLPAGGAAVETETVLLMPRVGEAGVTRENSDKSSGISVGDGWNAATGLGGSTPDVPVAVEFVVSLEVDPDAAVYLIDTTLLPDGETTAALYDSASGEPLGEEKKINICNRAPSVAASVQSGGLLAAEEDVSVTVGDNVWGLEKAVIYVNDDPVRTVTAPGTISLDGSVFNPGASNSIRFEASDKAGNTEISCLIFEVGEKPAFIFEPEGEGASFSSASADGTIYGVKLASNINMYQNRMGVYGYDSVRLSNETLVQYADRAEIVTEAVGGGLPYQSFVVSVKGAEGSAVVSYKGETGNGDDILLKAYNHREDRWDTLCRAKSGESVSFEASIVTYSQDGKMRITAMPATVANGSDTMLWNSDTQYYSSYDDLNFLYKSIVDYAAEQYAAGGIGYALHTGDLVDHAENDSVAAKQYGVASAMQKILDDAGVPNGVVAGNHDVRHDEAYYGYFSKYFGESRYSSFDWYGGSYSDNAGHFDLVNIGGYDFVVLYLPDHRETEPGVIAWANEVLKLYSGRNAIIALHEYILPSGEWSGSRAETVWNDIVVPNDNVKLVLCGHNFGAAANLRSVGDGGRQVLELLADYQFAELGTGPQHTENNMTCDGEGFIRLLKFNRAGQLEVSTYSPYHDIENYFPGYTDSLVYDLDLIRTPLSIRTYDFDVGLSPFAFSENPDGEFDGMFAKYEYGGQTYLTGIISKKTQENIYSVPEDTNEYTEAPLAVTAPWAAGVLPSLSYGSPDAQLPSDEVYEETASLMPAAEMLPVRTGGGSVFEHSVDGDGAYLLTLADGGGWITMSHTVTSPAFGEDAKLFMGISAPENARWNLIINTARGKSINFSQQLYRFFGYSDNCVPSDISGSWHGYIPLDGLADAEDYVKSVYFVSASEETEISFDWLFVGKVTGTSVIFRSGEAEREQLVAPGRVIYAPEDPSLPGMVFAGWNDENGNRAEFPAVAGESARTFTAVFEPCPQPVLPEALFEEAELAQITGTVQTSDSAAEESGGFPAWIGYGLIALVAVGIIFAATSKRAKKE